MDGVTAFANGLHWVINFFIISITFGAAGIVLMGFSITFRYSKKHSTLMSLIFAATGTALLIPAMIVGVIYSVGNILNIISNIAVGVGGIEWLWLPLVIAGIVFPVCVIVYDIKVIIKFIHEKKTKNINPYKTEEQKNG